ncbi:MAG: iduronate 2-sulfatase, partial [Rhodothermales bacterium]
NDDAAAFRTSITNGASLKTLPQHFGDNGYNAAGFAKLFHGNNATSNDETLSWNSGYTRATAPYLYYEDVKWQAYDGGDNSPSVTDKGEFNFRENPAEPVTDESYRDGLTATSAISQLGSFATDYVNSGQKFFLGVGFNKPHLPFNAPKAYWDLYDPNNIDLSGYDGNVDLPINGMDFTDPDFGELSGYTDIVGNSIAIDQAREMIHAYMACVSYIDAQIGRLLDALEAADASVRANTVIVVWSDHGWHLADHGAFWGKTTVFEQATRSACMIHAPGLDAAGSAGASCDAPVELVDLYPTLVDLCGLPQPVQPNSWALEGDSLSRLLQNPNRSWKSAAFSQFQKNLTGTSNTGWGMGYSMRTSQYRYSEWYVTDPVNRDTKAFATPEFVELYDYNTDPDEGTNVASSETVLAAEFATLLDGGAGWSTLNIPPNADTGGPYTSFPNGTFTLDASGSNAGDAAITSYEWDLNNNGSYTDATGVSTTHSFPAVGVYSIGLRVTDGNGEVHSASTTVAVNLDPRIGVWMLNTTGETGSSTDASIDAIVSAFSANVQEVWYTATDVYVKATTIPSYNIGPWAANPNDAVDQDITLRFPFDPQEETGTKTDTGLGSISHHINGTAIFNASDGQFVDGYERNANVFEAASFDAAQGHPAGNDNYHHHQRSPSLLAQLGDDGSGHSPIIGFSHDGFPIYGPYGYANTDGSGGVTRMETGYSIIAGARPGGAPAGNHDGSYIEDFEYSNTTHLDIHNGRFAVTPEFPAGIYHYHATIDGSGAPVYPYFIGPSYYGEYINSNRQGNNTIPGAAAQYLPPSANAGGSYNASVGSAIALSGSGSTAGNAAISTYEWDFDNDGKYDDATGATPSTTFFAVGTQTIGLRVIDANFAVSTATTTVEVTVAPGNPPTADAGGPYTANEGSAFSVDASGSVQGDAAIASYGWDLDGGGSYTDATGVNPSVTITDSDITSITVQVTATDNAVDTASATVTITNVAPTANAGGPYTASTGVAFSLDGSASTDPGNDITDYDWDTDNNSSYGDVTGVGPSVTFNTAGVYTIGLRVTDADGATNIAATTTVTVSDLTLIAPEQMSASDSDYFNKTMIRWHAVRGAALYRVLRHTVDDSGAASDIGTTDAPMFLDTTGTAGTTYFYWVQAENVGTVGPLTASDQGTRAVGAQAGPIPPLEPPSDPAGNATTAAKAALGKALFWDEQLSSTRTISCASCHQPEKGGLDPRGILGSAAATHPGPDGIFGTTDDVTGSPGVPGSLASGLYDWKDHFGIGVQATGRYPRPAIDAAYSDELFWDGRAGDAFVDPVSGSTILANGAALESQAAGPPVGDSEMAHNNRLWTEIVTRIDGATPLALATNIPSALTTWINGDQYNTLFEEVYGDITVTAPRIIMAIAAYERTLFSDRAPIDKVNAGIATLTGAQNRGRGVFNQNDCRQCHSGNTGSDELFHNIGIRPVNTDEDAGRFGVTANENDRGTFRTSHLRNVSLRGAFFHTGSVGSLSDVIDFYDRGGDFTAANKDPRVTNLNLSQNQKDELTAFLEMWTDPRVAAASDHFDHPTLYGGSAREPELFNAGIAGTGAVTPQVIAIEPPLGGNPNFTTGVYDGLAGAPAVLIIDVDEPGD